MTVGLNTSFLPPVATMAAVQQTPSCAWGCALPMQPIPDSDNDAWHCTGCGAIALRDGETDALDNPFIEPPVPDAIADVLTALQAAAELLGGYTHETVLPATTPVVGFRDAVQIEAAVRMSLGLLRSEPMMSHANAVHATAVEAAARICERRCRSLFHDSKDGLASLEARKCATAVRRIATRAALADRPELTVPQEVPS